MEFLAGGTHIALAGEQRFLCPDLNMGRVLDGRVGEHWLLWLAERWLGRSVRVDGKDVRQTEPVKPDELAMVLYAMLETDRELSAERGAPRQETEAMIRRCVHLGNIHELQATIARAVLSCFVSPGEAEGLDVRAEVAAPGSEPAPTPGVGPASSRSLRNWASRAWSFFGFRSAPGGTT